MVRLSSALGAAILGLFILLTQSRGAFVRLASFGLIAFRERLRQQPLVVPVIVSMIVVMFVPDSAWKRSGRSAAHQTPSRSPAKTRARRIHVVRFGRSPCRSFARVRLPAWRWAPTGCPLRDGAMVGSCRWRAAIVMPTAPIAPNPETGASGFFACWIDHVRVRQRERQRRRSRSTHPQLALHLGYLELGLVAFLTLKSGAVRLTRLLILAPHTHSRGDVSISKPARGRARGATNPSPRGDLARSTFAVLPTDRCAGIAGFVGWRRQPGQESPDRDVRRDSPSWTRRFRLFRRGRDRAGNATPQHHRCERRRAAVEMRTRRFK